MEGDVPFKLPEARKDGPASMKALIGDENRYFAPTGNSRVTTGGKAVQFAVGFDSRPCVLQFVI
jgi:hypothetical protein